MFLIALRKDNRAKQERVVVRQVVRVGQVTDLTERWYAINEGLPDQSLFALNYVINYWLEDAQKASHRITRNVPYQPCSCDPTVPALQLTRK